MKNNYTPTGYYGLTMYFPEDTMKGWQVLNGICLGFDIKLNKYIITLGENSTVIRYVKYVYMDKKQAWASIADEENK